VLLIILIGIAYSVVAPLMTPFALAYMRWGRAVGAVVSDFFLPPVLVDCSVFEAGWGARRRRGFKGLLLF